MTKMVQLSAAAYDRLRNAKRPKESFSDVVLRLTGGRKGALPLDALKGMLTEAEGDEMLRRIKELDSGPTRGRA